MRLHAACTILRLVNNELKLPRLEHTFSIDVERLEEVNSGMETFVLHYHHRHSVDLNLRALQVVLSVFRCCRKLMVVSGSKHGVVSPIVQISVEGVSTIMCSSRIPVVVQVVPIVAGAMIIAARRSSALVGI